jgi:hypothetical protein
MGASLGKNEVAVDPTLFRRQLGEGHSNVKSNACLLGQDLERSELP